MVDVKVGDVYGFSFPLLTNSSKKPVSVTGFAITAMPSGVKELGYPVYSEKDTVQYRLDYQFSPVQKSDLNLAKYPDYSGKPFTIEPGAQSDRYAMVKVEVTGPVSGHITGCEIEYTQTGKSFHQPVPCEFALDKG